jgi:2-C-methyl-D-erythritol 4-phosphate cytidylyltransferase
MISAIVTAAGSGTRMNLPYNKIFLEIDQKPLLFWTLSHLQKLENLCELLIVCSTTDQPAIESFCQSFPARIPLKIILGGSRRQDSVANGAYASSPQSEFLLIHDAVRPFCRLEKLRAVCHQAQIHGAALLATPLTSTLKKQKGAFLETLDRKALYLAQTPQVIRRQIYLQALARMTQEHWEVTDDISLIEKLGLPSALVEGDSYNLKITLPSDLPLAHFIHHHYFKNLEESSSP